MFCFSREGIRPASAFQRLICFLSVASRLVGHYLDIELNLVGLALRVTLHSSRVSLPAFPFNFSL